MNMLNNIYIMWHKPFIKIFVIYIRERNIILCNSRKKSKYKLHYEKENFDTRYRSHCLFRVHGFCPATGSPE